jgi:hypothetical protein
MLIIPSSATVTTPGTMRDAPGALRRPGRIQTVQMTRTESPCLPSRIGDIVEASVAQVRPTSDRRNPEERHMNWTHFANLAAAAVAVRLATAHDLRKTHARPATTLGPETLERTARRTPEWGRLEVRATRRGC